MKTEKQIENNIKELRSFVLSFIVITTLLLMVLISNAQTYYNIDAWTTDSPSESWEPTVGTITEYSGSIAINHPEVSCIILKYEGTYNNWYDSGNEFKSWNGIIPGELERMPIKLVKSYYKNDNNIYFSVQTGNRAGETLIFHVE